MNSTPKNPPNAEICELTDAELDTATGGVVSHFDSKDIAAIGKEAREFYDTWFRDPLSYQ